MPSCISWIEPQTVGYEFMNMNGYFVKLMVAFSAMNIKMLLSDDCTGLSE